MALDAQTQRLIKNTHDVKVTQAQIAARWIMREMEVALAQLARGEIPNSAIAEQAARYERATAALSAMDELDEIIKADGT